jgi:XRE family transcriptional regulator, aerobic/anaerobic benzoate catabolism transcriptional regulator
MSVHYNAFMQERLLAALGRAVRARRLARELTLVELAERSGLSPRFVAQLEAGEGNIAVGRLAALAEALGVRGSELLRAAEPSGVGERRVALIGLRGAGKSSVGERLAGRLGVPFVELDRRVEADAGMSLAEVFELQGEAFYRRLEREALRRVLHDHEGVVIATGGSLVGDPESWELLQRETRTLWLKAKPEEHMLRVQAQGDERPMKNRPSAMAELKALYRARAPLYAQAELCVDTSDQALDAVVAECVHALRAEPG